MDSEQEIRSLLQKLVGAKDGTDPAAFGRDLVCTPCGGNYESVAAWLIAVNGSPPRGMLVYNPHFDIPIQAFFIDVDRSRKLGDAQARIVRRFADEHLAEQSIDRATTLVLKGAGAR